MFMEINDFWHVEKSYKRKITKEKKFRYTPKEPSYSNWSFPL